MFTKSIRWRLQMWLAFLLVGILSGFGITAYQLHSTNRLSQIEEEFLRRVAALSRDTRMGPRPGLPPEHGPFGPDEFFDPRRKGPMPGSRGGTNRGGFGSDAFRDGGKGYSGPARKAPMPEPEGTGRTNKGGFGLPRKSPPFEAELEFHLEGMPMDGFGPPFMPPPWFRERGPESRRIQLSVSTAGLFDENDPFGFYYSIWSRNGTELKRTTNSPAESPFPNPSRTDTRIRTRTRGDYREAFQSTEMGDCVLAGRSIFADLAAIRRFAWLLIAAGGSVLLLGLGGGWLLATRAIRPIEDISATAGRIAAGNLAERINVAETDSELGRLAGVLNAAFTNLEAAFAQQRQFTADAAHELRTPLAVLISEAQTTLRRARSEAEYRETIETCLETAQQMRRLTQSLLELARLDGGREPLQRSPVDLAALASAVADFVSSLSQDRNIRISCDLMPALVLGDADRLSQVLSNLLNNAIQYGKDRGEVRVTTRVENGTVALSVGDDGPGIPADDLPHVFERFYRGDKARARANGHAGLGLAICKAIVDAHGGAIGAISELGRGTIVTVRFPAHAPQSAAPPPKSASGTDGRSTTR